MTNKEKKIRRILKNSRIRNGGYVNAQNRFIPDRLIGLNGTSAGIRIHYIIFGQPDHESINWILSLESPEGGFPAINQTTSMLETTFLAIETLHETENIGKLIYTDKHIQFILKHKSEIGGFIPTGKKNPTITSTYQAISIFRMLDIKSSNIENKEKHGEWLITEWLLLDTKHNVSIEETYYLIYCLKCLNLFEGQIRERIINQWLPLNKSIMQSKTPQTGFSMTYYYLKLINELDMQGNDIILVKTKENLLKQLQRQKTN